MEKINTWRVLSSIDCKEHIEKKNGLTYLSWAWAWGMTKTKFPDANYRVINFDAKPYLFDENLGYLVQTEVTIEGETIPMQLPVMDGANKAQKNITYTYKVKEYINGRWTGKYIDKEVGPATMFDINTAIMRCLTKNLAMFGLGHYIYAGEDLPTHQEPQEQNANNSVKPNIQDNSKLFLEISEKINTINSLEELKSAYKKYEKYAISDAKIKKLFTARREQIKSLNNDK